MTKADEAFVEQHWRLALWVARRRVQHACGGLDSADAESDALLGLWQAAQTFDAAKGAAETWTRWVVDRAITDGIRARTHRGAAPHSIHLDDVPETLLPVGASPANDVATRVDLRRAATRLPGRQREVLSRWLDGETLATIALDLRITESAASRLLQGARLRLRTPPSLPAPRRPRRPVPVPQLPTALCDWCGTQFIGKGDARYCSNAHRQAAHRARKVLASDNGPHLRVTRRWGPRLRSSGRHGRCGVRSVTLDNVQA